MRHVVFTLLLLASLLAGCAPPAAPPATPTAPPPSPAAVPPTPSLAPPGPQADASTPVPPSPTAAPATATPLPASPSPTLAPPAPAPASTSSFPLTVVDDTGRAVTFDHPPQRIISLSPGHTETLYALGLGDRVIATDQYSDYPAANKPKAKLNTFPKPNLEEIVALKPDLVLVLVEGDEVIDAMRARGITVLKLFPRTLEDTLKDIALVGRVTGTAERATQLTNGMRERIAAVVAKTKDAPKPRVLYELDASDPTKPYVAGPTGFFGNLIPLAGGKNVFDDLKQSAAPVSAEQIIARDPEIIILGDSTVPFNPQTPAMVRARPGWSQITAVRTGRIYPLDDNLVERPGPRLADGLAQLAKFIHPELFP